MSFSDVRSPVIPTSVGNNIDDKKNQDGITDAPRKKNPVETQDQVASQEPSD